MLLTSGVASATEYTIRRESWPRDTVEGWRDGTANWVVSLGSQPPADKTLTGEYGGQSVPLPQSDAFVADAGASQGWFAGDYTAGSNVPLHVSFDFLPVDVEPSLLLFRLAGTAGGSTNVFFVPLTNQIAGAGDWRHITVPLQYDFADWVGPGAETFTNTLSDVRRLEVQVIRSGTNAQAYAIDNFAITFLVPTGVATNDTDGDGLPDYWETDHFGGPTNALVGVDSDGDTMSNWAEFVAGTDPLDILSLLRIDSGTPAAEGFTLWFSSVLGRQYQVGFRQDLNDPSWQWSPPWVSGGGAYTNLMGTNVTAQGYYRIRVRREE